MIGFTLATLLLAQDAQQMEMRLMRFPAIYGDQVVFVYANDLWTSNVDGGLARRLTSSPGAESYPHFSPDGKWIAFTGTYDGNPDVYVIPSEGGEPKRLTFTPSPDIVIDWSAKKGIAFHNGEESLGGFVDRLWFVSPNGGMPVRTPVLEIDQGRISPDGTMLAYNRAGSEYFNWRRYRGGTQGKISFWNFNTNQYSEMPGQGRENSWEPLWLNGQVYYISDKNQGTVNLYRYNPSSKKSEQLTNYSDADIKWPNTDGKNIVFERDGYLYLFSPDSKKVRRLYANVAGDKVSARPMLRQLGNQISSISLSPSGARVAVEARGAIFSLPAKSGDTRELAPNSASRERFPTWSPDGKTIAFLSDRSGEMEIYTIPQMGGIPTQLTSNGQYKVTQIAWSPDGKTISFTTAENDLMLLDVATKKVTKVFTNKFGSADTYDWSADSSWIAYIDVRPNLFGALFLYNVQSGKSTQVTEGFYRDDQVSFDLNGKYLYLISSRTFNPVGGAFEYIMQVEGPQRIYVLPLTRDTTSPLVAPSDEEPGGGEEAAPKPAPGTPPPGGAAGGQPGQQAQQGAPPQPPAKQPMKIDLEGLGERLIPLPMPAGDYQGIAGVRDGVVYFTGGVLKKFDLKSRESQDLTAEPMPVNLFSSNPDRTKFAYYGNGVLGIVDLRPGIRFGAGRVNTSDVNAVIDPRQEWKQIFEESWRYMRDRFYDANYTGVNWKAVRSQYEKYLPYVAHRADLNYVLGLMIGELGTGHSYVGGGDMGVSVPGVPIGVLGADLEPTANAYRIAKIYRGIGFEEGQRGPLVEPGLDVKEGEYILAIDGKPVSSDKAIGEFLVNKVNKSVQLTINSTPSMAGARKVTVRPIASDDSLRYRDWVEENRRKVSQMSGGRIGYMHVPNTSTEGVIEFVRSYYSQSDKQAMIVDERFNGGGMIPSFFVERLSRRYMTAFRQRYGDDIMFPPQTVEGPMAMLINGYAGSGGDLFPWMFKEAKLGPLIGKRTWGGLVGIRGSAPLVDGGFLSAPEFGLYDFRTGKWIAENTGIDPDMDIDARPDLLAKGQDPQLEAAVKYLLDELKKPPSQRKRPDFPINVPPRTAG